MKKILPLILVAALMFSLAACDGGVDGTTSTDTQNNVPMQSADENIAENESSIEFEEPFVILDNELATVEITQFYQEEVKYSSDSDPVKESNIVAPSWRTRSPGARASIGTMGSGRKTGKDRFPIRTDCALLLILRWRNAPLIWTNFSI